MHVVMCDFEFLLALAYTLEVHAAFQNLFNIYFLGKSDSHGHHEFHQGYSGRDDWLPTVTRGPVEESYTTERFAGENAAARSE